jgi:hypothetical protein
MRGGAQSQLMLGADGNLWVVKFQNNPQHLRVLANELIATRIAEAVGLSVPKTDVIEVSDWLIANSAELVVDKGRGVRERCAGGLQFGSRFVGGLMPGQVVDYLPEPQMDEVRNFGQPGRLHQLEGRVEEHERSVQRLKGAGIVFGGVLTMLHIVIGYLIEHYARL